MPKYDKIEDLVSELYKNRKLLSALFEQRMSAMHTESVLPLVNNDDENLQVLSDYGIINYESNNVSLDIRIKDFFEEFMEVEETVHILHIQENLDSIYEQIDYYNKENSRVKKERYLQKIKNNLRRIKNITITNVKTIRSITDEAYKSESNYELKRKKLENIRQQRDALEEILESVDKLISLDKFFSTTADSELRTILHNLRLTLSENRHNLIEIQQQIIEYLNSIEHRAEMIKKVLKLKSLKDKFQLKECSNFYDVVAKMKAMSVKPKEVIKTRLAPYEISSNPKMHELILRIRKSLNNNKLLAEKIAGAILNEELFDNDTVENIIDLDMVKTKFCETDVDLFSYIMNYSFKDTIDRNERLKLYCKLASIYTSELEFSDDYRVDNDIEYTLIFPKK